MVFALFGPLILDPRIVLLASFSSLRAPLSLLLPQPLTQALPDTLLASRIPLLVPP